METRPWHQHYDYNVPTSIRYPRIPAHSIFQLPADSFPDKPATNFYGTEMTFWELRSHVLRMTNALGELGVQKGDRVGIHLPNCPQFIIAYLATLSLGGVVVNMNPIYTTDEIKFIMSNTQMSTLIIFDMVLPIVRPAVNDVRIKRVVVTGVTDYISGFGVSTPKDLELDEGWHHFSQLIENCTKTTLPRINILQQDPAMIQFTGGTTGVPKGALFPQACNSGNHCRNPLWVKSCARPLGRKRGQREKRPHSGELYFTLTAPYDK